MPSPAAAPSDGEPRGSRRRLVALVSGLVAVGIGVGLGLWVTGALGGSAKSPGARVVRFVDRRDRLALTYPASWHRLRSADSEVLLLAAGSGAALLLRLAPLPFDASAHPVRAARELGAAALYERPGVTPLDHRAIRLGGLRGFAFTYLIRTGTGGRRALHLEYFLPRGRQLITLVLQSPSARPPASVSASFAHIAASFRSGPSAL